MRVVLGSWGRAGQYRREIIALGWLAGLTVACWLADFPVASAAFVLLYGLTCTRSYFPGLRGRLLFSIVSAVCIYFAVYEMFNISGAFFTSVL